MLDRTPEAIFDQEGRPLLGRYAGPLAPVDLGSAGGALRFLRRKRWLYMLVATREHLCAAAIVDVGYAANAFAVVASPAGGMLAEVSALGLPKIGVHVGDVPEDGCDAWFRGGGLHASFSRPIGASAYRLQVQARDLSIDVVLDTAGAPPPLAAIARPAGGDVNVTQKRALLHGAGVIRVGRDTVPLDDAVGGLDYTQGLLPRHTVWRWAYLVGAAADGTPVGLNLVEGFNGEAECGVWVGGALHPVGEGRFEYDPQNLLAPWRITTTCGAVDLRFQPFAMHLERRNLLVIRSRFAQPIGRYTGQLRLPGGPPLQLDGVLGVAEDQDMLW